MTTVQLDEEAIYHVARLITDPEARDAYLRQVCGDDVARRDRLDALLRVCDLEPSFLEPLPVDATAELTGPAEREGAAIGPYTLLEAIGEGGMGTVYMADQTEPVRRRVALKVIKPGMDTEQVVARFEAERQALAQMDHPNIAKVHDGGMTPSGRPYFAMELVRGLPITEYCDQHELSIPERLELFVLVCRAVQHAHQKGVIHRDLKPSNVLVTVVDGVGVPKVIDFGIAKATGQALTEKTLFTGFHQFVGTPLYVSPEQAEMSGVDVDTRSDIYSLGVLLYELLTGTTPFDPETLRQAAFDEMRRIIREEEPPRPSMRLSSLGETLTSVSAQRKADPRRLGGSMKGELDWLVMKALEKDRCRRYETANDFAADVMRYLTDRPVEAFPPSAWYRFTKFARRNQLAILAGSVVVLSLVAGTAVSTWQGFRAAEAERHANADRLRADKRSQLARRAVDEMYEQVAEKWLADQPNLTALQREFLEKAQAIYEQLAAEQADDPATRLDVALARLKVGRIGIAMGRFDEAAGTLRRAIDECRALVDRIPHEPRYRHALGRCLRQLGFLHSSLQQYREAEPFYRLAIGQFERLAAEHPADLEYRKDLAIAYQNLANSTDREEDSSRAVELCESVLAEAPKDVVARDTLALALMTRAGILKTTHITEESDASVDLRWLGEAERLDRRVVELQEGLLADGSTQPVPTPYLRTSLAITLINLHNTQHALNRPDDAIATMRRAESLLEDLVNDYPEHLEHHQTLAGCLLNLASTLHRDGQEAEADEATRRGVELAESILREHPEISRKPSLAYYLALAADRYSVSPDGPFYDPARALKLARRAVELQPAQAGLAWESLGWASYRAGEWKCCIESLEKRESYPREGDFFAAMAHWRLDDAAKAREVFARADATLAADEKRSKPGRYPDVAMRRQIRAEAAGLLGIDHGESDAGRPVPKPQ
ncbi:protein kinase domain-containing protein [Tautonia plasticadhaerens]|uniref:Serine/threonine-protein kinase PknB n=1 Tax=Tautonia plasticadhaerens TaxID=2527974 RepID=A0A518HF74_9BACT|nr:protein kinase [Tautonia plasticadhaerens]QDV39493.1 Serine/threonine-protein kinase PknB [Tautonia plasticadhaerens]